MEADGLNAGPRGLEGARERPQGRSGRGDCPASMSENVPKRSIRSAFGKFTGSRIAQDRRSRVSEG